jgi:O-antigen/teichoic acid export membrane protein
VGYRLAQGAFWSLVGTAGSQGLQFLSVVAVARLLGKTGFGELAVIQSTVGLFGIFGAFGMGVTATKHVAQFRAVDPARAGRVMALSGVVAFATSAVMAAVLAIAAPWLASHTLAAPHLAGPLRLTSVLLLISGLNGAQAGALAGLEAFGAVARVTVLGSAVAFPLMIAWTYSSGLPGTIRAMIVGAGVTWCLSHLALRREARRASVPFSFRGCLAEREVLWRFSLPSTIAGSLVAPVTWLCSALLVNQPGGYEQMGIYNAVLRVRQIPEVVGNAALAALLPMLSAQFGNKDVAGYAKTLRIAFYLSAAVVAPASLLLTALPALTMLVFGGSYRGNASVVQWVMLQLLIAGLLAPFGRILPSMNRMWFGFVYNLGWGVLIVASTYVLLPYGAKGLAAASAFTQLTASLVCLVYIRQRERAFITGVPVFSLLLAGLAAFGVCCGASQLAPAAVPALAAFGTIGLFLWYSWVLLLRDARGLGGWAHLDS